MGTNGMSVKNTIIIGKTARKKLKAIEDARVVIEPLKILSIVVLLIQIVLIILRDLKRGSITGR